MATSAALDRLPQPHRPRALTTGVILLAIILAVSLAAPWIAPYSFEAMDAAARMQPPSMQHWLGTDEFGRDVFSRVLYGGSSSILLGVCATALSFAIGVPLGLLAGYLRGWVDDAVMRMVDIVISVPPVMLGLLILASTDPSLWKAALAVGIIYIPIMIRLARGMTLSLTHEEFITAARAGRTPPLDSVARDPPQRAASPHRRGFPAREFRHSAGRRLQLSRSRHPAALLRLGTDGR